MGRVSLGVAAAAVLAQTVLMAVMFGGVLPLVGDADPFDGTARDFGAVALVHAVDLAVIAAILALGGGTAAALGWTAPRPADLGLGLAGALICASVVAGIGLGLGGAEGLRETVLGFGSFTPAQRVLFVLIGVGAALCEETVFRGALYPALRARIGPAAAIAVSAVVFSAYHLKFHPVIFLGKAAYGVVFAALRERTGSNWAPALAHAGFWVLVGTT